MQRHLPDGDAAVEHDVGEHKQLEKLMKEWEVAEAGDADFDRVLRQLEEVLRDHVHDEESEQFPQLRSHIPHDELVGMAERVSVFGGQLDHGRTDDGRFELTATLPVAGELV